MKEKIQEIDFEKKDCICDKCNYRDKVIPGNDCRYCTKGGTFKEVDLHEGYKRKY